MWTDLDRSLCSKAFGIHRLGEEDDDLHEPAVVGDVAIIGDHVDHPRWELLGADVEGNIDVGDLISLKGDSSGSAFCDGGALSLILDASKDSDIDGHIGETTLLEPYRWKGSIAEIDGRDELQIGGVVVNVAYLEDVARRLLSWFVKALLAVDDEDDGVDPLEQLLGGVDVRVLDELDVDGSGRLWIRIIRIGSTSLYSTTSGEQKESDEKIYALHDAHYSTFCAIGDAHELTSGELEVAQSQILLAHMVIGNVMFSECYVVLS